MSRRVVPSILVAAGAAAIVVLIHATSVGAQRGGTPTATPCPRGGCDTATPTPSASTTPTPSATATSTATATPTPTPVVIARPGDMVLAVDNRQLPAGQVFSSDFYDVRACSRLTVSLVSTLAFSSASHVLLVQNSLDGVRDHGTLTSASVASGISWQATGYVLNAGAAFGGATTLPTLGLPARSSSTLTPYAPRIRFTMQASESESQPVTFSVLFYCAS